MGKNQVRNKIIMLIQQTLVLQALSKGSDVTYLHLTALSPANQQSPRALVGAWLCPLLLPVPIKIIILKDKAGSRLTHLPPALGSWSTLRSHTVLPLGCKQQARSFWGLPSHVPHLLGGLLPALRSQHLGVSPGVCTGPEQGGRALSCIYPQPAQVPDPMYNQLRPLSSSSGTWAGPRPRPLLLWPCGDLLGARGENLPERRGRPVGQTGPGHRAFAGGQWAELGWTFWGPAGQALWEPSAQTQSPSGTPLQAQKVKGKPSPARPAAAA